MSNPRKERISSSICQLAAEFLGQKINHTSLITVTNCVINGNMQQATVYISVLPDSAEKEALDFAQRQAGQIRQFISKKVKMGRVPFIDVEIDGGEKNRRNIDRIIKSK